jgi:antitoxin component YwqK of YwqJK toxin-antitoxin module
MRKLFTTIVLLLFVWIVKAQEIGFVTTYDINLSDYMTTTGKVYLANGQVISKDKYDFYKESWNEAKNCKPCEVYTYNVKDELKHVVIQYEGCLLGPFIEYYSDGKIKVECNFKSNPSNDYSNLRLRDLCSMREGNWSYYNESGKIQTIETYENGSLVKTEEIKDTVKMDSNTLGKIKGFFKKSSDTEE